MPDHDGATKLSTTLYDLLVEDREIPDLLNDLARLSAEHFREDQDVDCGIILRRDKKSVVVASSSARAEQMDEMQMGFGDGPCLQALATQEIVTVPDVRTEERWPEYMGVVRDHGLGSALAIPMRLGEVGQAAMNLYTLRPGVFTDEDVADAKRYAELTAKALRIALRTADHAAAAQHRQAAMEHRTPIDIAIGIIMAQNGCSQNDAFSILREASSHRNVKLRDLAQEIVASIDRETADTSFEN